MLSANASAIAQSVTLPSVASACAAAPLPRPPQPMRPTLISSLPATNARAGDLGVGAKDDAAGDERRGALMNCRRDGSVERGSPGAGNMSRPPEYAR